MLLIDGVRYEEWVPQTEDEFEQVVKEHTQDIFGEQSIYIDRKQKLKSLSGIGSIPDGYVIMFGDTPHWHIVEVELSSHPLHEHIVSQVSRFITGIGNPTTQREVARAIYGEIVGDGFLKLKVEQVIQSTEIYKFLADLIAEQPILTIVIEKDTENLREALSTLRYPQIKVVDFQTFVREGAGLPVHAHLFEPLAATSKKGNEVKPQGGACGKKKRQITVTVKDLIDANILEVGQVIYKDYKDQIFEGRVLDDGSIQLIHTGVKFGSLSGAAKGIAGSVDGWEWWHTKKGDGTQCTMDELRKEYRATHPSNP